MYLEEGIFILEKIMQEHIKIYSSDLVSVYGVNAVQSRFRQIENYLEKHKYEHELIDQVCIVYVKDKLDAIGLRIKFKLLSVEYFNGERSQKLNLKQIPMKSPKIEYRTMDGQKLKKKEFVARQKEFAVQDGLSRAEVIKRKIFTAGEINKLIEARVLVPVEYRSKVYFSKIDLQNGLKYLSGLMKREVN